MPPLRIAFMGTPDFALTALEALHTSGHDVVAVYTQPPRPKGRGQQVQISPVHQYAADHDIPVYHPRSLKKEKDQAVFAELNLDVAVVAAYGLILPKAVLNAPKYGCINIHASLLPRWRGASPIQHAIWKGDAETGVDLMQMDEGLDTGPVIMERKVKIRPQTTAASLHDELSALGAAMIEEAMDELAAGKGLEAHLQDDDLATYAPLLQKEDGRVDWSQSAEEIDRQVRALNPWPGVWSMIEGKRVKILEVQISQANSDQAPGTILDSTGKVACGRGPVLTLVKIQPENAKAMDFVSAVNGGYVEAGKVFS